MNHGCNLIVSPFNIFQARLKEFGDVDLSSTLKVYKVFTKVGWGPWLKRKLCLWPAYVINCTPLSTLSFWVSLFPGAFGYNTSCHLREREKMSDTCRLFPPFGDPWIPACYPLDLYSACGSSTGVCSWGCPGGLAQGGPGVEVVQLFGLQGPWRYQVSWITAASAAELWYY